MLLTIEYLLATANVEFVSDQSNVGDILWIN